MDGKHVKASESTVLSSCGANLKKKVTSSNSFKNDEKFYWSESMSGVRLCVETDSL